MTISHVVELRFKKQPDRRLQLDYEQVLMFKWQRRFEGRSQLEPVFDLSAYKCRAVIDWVDIEVLLGRPSQFRHLQDTIGQVLPRVQWVEPLEHHPGGTASRFRIRIQQPSLAQVEQALNAARLEYAFGAEPIVTGLEVSVDFTPKDFSDDARARMVGLLVWHLFPDFDFMSNDADHPRFTWGKRKDQTRHLIKSNNKALSPGDYTRHNLGDRPSPVDATFYVGRAHGPLYWSVQNKVSDQRNPGKGTVAELAEKDRRARVEVTLGIEELAEMGIKHFSDLRRFRFGKLQGRYFRVMLPTILTDPRGEHPMADVLLDRRRITKFKNTGVVGLAAMDDAREAMKVEHRAELTKAHKRIETKARKRIAPKTRVGIGSSGSFVAYEGLGRRFESALRQLTKSQR